MVGSNLTILDQITKFFLLLSVCDDANIYICIALKIINTPVN
jgi:hypothetical protein